MKVLDHVRLIVYRFHEKGLEILMIKRDHDKWVLPSGAQISLDNLRSDEIIELQAQTDSDGQPIKAVAIEGDWHEIPSIRGLIKQDIHLVKARLKELIPELENGTYLAIKDAFKRLMPREYALLKELKDILLDRNLVRNI